jgi:polyisoprenoid-binding protein YceI
MKPLAILTGVLALAAPLAFAQTSTWVSDPNHSEVDFTITHMSISKVHGRFGNVNATIQYDPADVARSSVKVIIDVATVDTGVQPRDSDLKSPNYFDVANFPTATFTSTGVARNGNKLTVIGNLTLHGVTNPVVLDVEGPNGPAQGMDHKPHVGFSATTTINRTTFGIAPGMPAGMVGDEVTLTIEIDAAKQ